MTKEKLVQLVNDGREHIFYCSRAWHNKRKKILKADRYECQICKSQGKYSRTTVVHHVQHLRDRPDLGLSDTYVDADGVEHRQLVSVCENCHKTVCHPDQITK